MKSEISAVNRNAQERVLADAMVDVATELRLTDPLEFLMLVRNQHDANLADLVNSSSELFFHNGALRYGLAASCLLRWGTTPSVALDMEFRHRDVTVFFRLIIERAHAGVEIIDVFFETGDDIDPALAHRKLELAIADARLK